MTKFKEKDIIYVARDCSESYLTSMFLYEHPTSLGEKGIIKSIVVNFAGVFYSVSFDNKSLNSPSNGEEYYWFREDLIERVVEETVQEDHTGMIQNPMTGEWSWF